MSMQTVRNPADLWAVCRQQQLFPKCLRKKNLSVFRLLPIHTVSAFMSKHLLVWFQREVVPCGCLIPSII